MDERAKFNPRNPAVKRIMQEVREFQKEDGKEMMARALEDNIFEWHFAVRGPPDSEFEGGIYHGRIIMPPDYPFKPPAFMLLTPNGRFETGVKICLSISAHHPEHWQPSWSVRTALTALIAFMPTSANGALGSLDFPLEERKRLALRSRAEPPRFGAPARQEVIEEVHQKMLALESVSPRPQEQVSIVRPDPEACEQPSPINRLNAPLNTSAQAAEPSSSPEQRQSEQRLSEQRLPGPIDRSAAVEGSHGREGGTDWEDRGLGILAAAISIAIMAILGRKALYIAGIDIYEFF